jgi:hypothetical protein
MQKWREHGRSETFHAWRKRVKTVWYVMRLLQGRIRLGRQVADLKRLETWLGEDHYLTVLRTRILSADGAASAVRLKALVEREQNALRRKALSLGSRRFRQTPKRFVRHVHRLADQKNVR